MKLGVFTVLLGDRPLDEVCKYLAESGVQTVEIGTGGYPDTAHCETTELLADAGKLTAFKETIAKYNLEISALSCHGNPVHPVKAIADEFHTDFMNTAKLGEKLGVDRIVTFSGCPAGSAKGDIPNWITCPWPDDFTDALSYQWDDILIPYWQKTTAMASDYGIKKIALEMHPGFCVYNPETMLKLRAAVGETLGANFDPSHLFWQGIDGVAAIRYLGDAILYVHAKDTKIDEINTAKIGVLDTKHYGDEINRAWVFRTVGYGHGYQVWKDMISNLRMIGYDDVISIEHEDSLMSPTEGLQKAIAFLKEVMTFEDMGEMWWA